MKDEEDEEEETGLLADTCKNSTIIPRRPQEATHQRRPAATSVTRVFVLGFAVLGVALLCMQLLILATRGFGANLGVSAHVEEEAPLPLLLKLHKTGGTSVAQALARNVFCGDKAYGRWRDWLDGDETLVDLMDYHHHEPFGTHEDNLTGKTTTTTTSLRRGGPSSEQKLYVVEEKVRGTGIVRSVVPDIVRSVGASFCGNYDGHWATKAYRSLGAGGMRSCGGLFPQRRKVKLIVMLRDPVPRFISRLYYEIGGESDLLLSAPFSSPVESWTRDDVRQMEQLACDACRRINGGHCAWRGGLCDTPQEYLVVLSQFGMYGHRKGALQRAGDSKDASDAGPYVSPPAADLGHIDQMRRAASKALRDDFAAVGVLEDFHTFLAIVADALDWPLESMLYNPKKVHVDADKFAPQEACDLRTDQPKSTLTEGVSTRVDERMVKKANAKAAKQNDTSVAWSGVFPLLGWNKPSKQQPSAEVLEYIRNRNSDDLELWQLARSLATKRVAQHDVDVLKLDVLQAAYGVSLIPDSKGYFSFCDWRVKDRDKARQGAEDLNAACRRCAADLNMVPCDISSDDRPAPLRTRCRANQDIQPTPQLTLQYSHS